MLITWPFLRRMRPGSSSRVIRTRPVRFASTIPSRSSSWTSAMWALPSAPPALLMRISGSSSSAAAANLWIESRERTSSGRARALGDPALRAASATFCSFSILRAPSTSGWPSFPKASANASPNPADAPVTTTVPGISDLPHVQGKGELPAAFGVRSVAGLDDLDARDGFAKLRPHVVAGRDRRLELLEERVEPLLVRGVHPVAFDDALLDAGLGARPMLRAARSARRGQSPLLQGARRQLPLVVVDDQGAIRSLQGVDDLAHPCGPRQEAVRVAVREGEDAVQVVLGVELPVERE